jgi:hypothetical protein
VVTKREKGKKEKRRTTGRRATQKQASRYLQAGGLGLCQLNTPLITWKKMWVYFILKLYLTFSLKESTK